MNCFYSFYILLNTTPTITMHKKCQKEIALLCARVHQICKQTSFDQFRSKSNFRNQQMIFIKTWKPKQFYWWQDATKLKEGQTNSQKGHHSVHQCEEFHELLLRRIWAGNKIQRDFRYEIFFKAFWQDKTIES